MDLGFCRVASWSQAERTLARGFGLRVYPANDRIWELVAEEIRVSDFSTAEIAEAFARESHSIQRFGQLWYADCQLKDYGEEWHPDEGNQQDSDRKSRTLGIGEGFLVGYTLLYLYAKQRAGLLLGFLQRRRIPHAKKVAGDVARVFAEAMGE